jgi:hypothetical protein
MVVCACPVTRLCLLCWFCVPPCVSRRSYSVCWYGPHPSSRLVVYLHFTRIRVGTFLSLPLMPSQVRSVRLLLTFRRCQHPPQRFSPVLVPYPSTLFIPSCVCVLAFSSLRVIALMRRRFQSPHPLPFRLRHCTRQSLAVSFLFPRHLPYRHRTTPRSILHTHPSVFMYTQCCYCPSHH